MGSVPFIKPLTTPVNLWFSGDFRGSKMGALPSYGLTFGIIFKSYFYVKKLELTMMQWCFQSSLYKKCQKIFHYGFLHFCVHCFSVKLKLTSNKCFHFLNVNYIILYFTDINATKSISISLFTAINHCFAQTRMLNLKGFLSLKLSILII